MFRMTRRDVTATITATNLAKAAFFTAALLGSGPARAAVSDSLAVAENGSPEVAFNQFRVRAATGDVDAQIYLGELYRGGLDVTGDSGKAFGWYLRAAEQGHTTGQSKVGSAYYYGLGVPRDYDLAGDWYLKAARKGDPTAILNLGRMYTEGHGVSRDPTQAYMWFTIGARLGDKESRELGTGIRSGLTTLEIQRALDMVNAQLAQFER